jgi:hypothetical protein
MQVVAGKIGTFKTKLQSLLGNAFKNLAGLSPFERGNYSALRSASTAGGILKWHLNFFGNNFSYFFVVVGQIKGAIKTIQPARSGHLCVIHKAS